jgi:hypothetical protein
MLKDKNEKMIKAKKVPIATDKQHVTTAFTRQFAKHPKLFTVLSIIGFVALVIVDIPIMEIGWNTSIFGLIPGAGAFYYATGGTAYSPFQRMTGVSDTDPTGTWPDFPMFQIHGVQTEWLFVIIGTLLFCLVIAGFIYLGITLGKSIHDAFIELKAVAKEENKTADIALETVLGPEALKVPEVKKDEPKPTPTITPASTPTSTGKDEKKANMTSDGIDLDKLSPAQLDAMLKDPEHWKDHASTATTDEKK